MRTDPSDTHSPLPLSASRIARDSDVDVPTGATIVITLLLRPADASWRILVHRRDHRLELSGLDELLVYLDALAREPGAAVVSGLR